MMPLNNKMKKFNATIVKRYSEFWNPILSQDLFKKCANGNKSKGFLTKMQKLTRRK